MRGKGARPGENMPSGRNLRRLSYKSINQLYYLNNLSVVTGPNGSR